MTCYAKGQGRIGISNGTCEIVFGLDGNLEEIEDIDALDACALVFWGALRHTYKPHAGALVLHFGPAIRASVSPDGEVALDYRPNKATRLFWGLVAIHWPGRPQTVAPKPVVFRKGYEGDECCPAYDAGYACPCPATEPSPKPFDFDAYNGVKR